MALRPDPEVGYRRPGDHRLADGRVERRVFVQASPRVVWATLHDPSSSAELFPELRFGPAAPSWPAAATTRPATTRLGLLRERASAESLEARPDSRFRLRVTGSGFDSEWSWQLEPAAGGTRVDPLGDLPALRPLDGHPRAARRLVGPEPRRGAPARAQGAGRSRGVDQLRGLTQGNH